MTGDKCRIVKYFRLRCYVDIGLYEESMGEAK